MWGTDTERGRFSPVVHFEAVQRRQLVGPDGRGRLALVGKLAQ